MFLTIIWLGARFFKKSIFYKTASVEVQDQRVISLDPDVYHFPENYYNRGLNLIFFSDGYLSWPEFDSDIQLLLQQIKTVEPWKSFSRYNIYKIFSKELDVCLIKTKDERKPVLRCDPDRVNAYLNKIRTGSFKLIVLSRRDFQSWANISRLTDSGIFFSLPTPIKEPAVTGILFLHLLGHAFGLKDEELFVIAKADSEAHEPNGPNCAPDRQTAKKWWGDLVGQRDVGYFFGCAANEEFIKPTTSSIMNLNDLSNFVPDYGPVSERYLQKVLDYCFSDKPYSVSDDPNFFAQYPEFKECVSK